MSFYDDLIEDLRAILEAEKGDRELITVPNMPAPTYVICDQRENKQNFRLVYCFATKAEFL